jgi:hypothetical protein
LQAITTFKQPFFDQPQMKRHWTEVAVLVKKWPVVVDARVADREVDGLADGNRACAGLLLRWALIKIVRFISMLAATTNGVPDLSPFVH